MVMQITIDIKQRVKVERYKSKEINSLKLYIWVNVLQGKERKDVIDSIYWTYHENNVSLPAERKFLIVGQSGSGKTTLARYLCVKYLEMFWGKV